MVRRLSKSRFKLALECPTKLDYTGRPEYRDLKVEDDFLKALADGGFQVGALAQLMHPGGVEVADSNPEDAAARTIRLMQREQVTLFEAAFIVDDFVMRADILIRDGNRLDLIEVKAKSFDSAEGTSTWLTRDGNISSDMLPYLQDVAFQKFVLERACPGFDVHCWLMMPDKAKRTSIDGLNQLFRIQRGPGGLAKVTVVPGTTIEGIGEPILTKVRVDSFVSQILQQQLVAPGFHGSFASLAKQWADAYAASRRISPTLTSDCGKCEFRNDDPEDERLSGFHECWKEALGWRDEDFADGTVLDLYNYRKKQKLMNQGVFKLKDVREEDLDIKPDSKGISGSERRWMQVSGQWEGGGEYYLDRAAVESEMRSWSYPLHFIDFEACQTALPFRAGRPPYARVAFQFSHHTMQADGTVEHSAEFIDLTLGADPSWEFLRSLKTSVGPVGTILMWSSYENTVLRQLGRELRQCMGEGSAPSDAAELLQFIEDVTTDKDNHRKGRRAMVDLAEIAKRHFFHSDTKGRVSIKAVLPALMRTSAYLREKYSKPIYGAANGIPSHNFTDQVWWRMEDGVVMDPYELLPPLFHDIERDELDRIERDTDTEIREGGAAGSAYARLQFDLLPEVEREATRYALLRYCELDTLAMVMCLEAWLWG